MRSIGAKPILIFCTLLALNIATAILTTITIIKIIPLGNYQPLAVVGLIVILVYIYGIGVYRLFLKINPLPEGEILEGSRDEFVYHVYLLFFLILFYQLIRTKLLPVPFQRLIYLALGARLGVNTYSSGTILDPWFTTVGDNTIIGEDSLMYAHAIEGTHLSHKKIRIGNSVTIGAKSIIMSGVTIGDGAIIAAGSVVIKNSTIGANEVWGGTPARRLSARNGRNRQSS